MSDLRERAQGVAVSILPCECGFKAQELMGETGAHENGEYFTCPASFRPAIVEALVRFAEEARAEVTAHCEQHHFIVRPMTKADWAAPTMDDCGACGRSPCTCPEPADDAPAKGGE